MPHTQTSASDQHRQPPGVTTVPRGATVRVARVNRKALFWTVAVATVVVALSFVSIVVHGLIITNKW